jgi:hypothetical protein
VPPLLVLELVDTLLEAAEVGTGSIVVQEKKKQVRVGG